MHQSSISQLTAQLRSPCALENCTMHDYRYHTRPQSPHKPFVSSHELVSISVHTFRRWITVASLQRLNAYIRYVNRTADRMEHF